MLDHAADAIPLFAKFKESLYSFVLFGMTTQQKNYFGELITAAVIGIGSAYAVSYVNAERNAVKLDATIARLDVANKEQSEFRAEMRGVITQRAVFEQIMAERVAVLEATMKATHPNWPMQAGMQGNGNGRAK